MNFDRLKFIRQRKDYTQNKLANILNVKRSAYSLWEIGVNIIPLEKLLLFSNFFNISMDYLCDMTDDKKILFPHKTLDKKEVGHKIKITRKELKMTQSDLALKFNTTHSAISSYESGKVLIPTLFLTEFSKISGKSMDWFCSSEEII